MQVGRGSNAKRQGQQCKEAVTVLRADRGNDAGERGLQYGKAGSKSGSRLSKRKKKHTDRLTNLQSYTIA